MISSLFNFKNKLVSTVYIDAHNIKHTILIAGTGRSGTTWLSNTINYKNQFRYIFEPLHSNKVNFDVSVIHNQYIHPEEINIEAKELMHRILSGNIRSNWTDKYNKRLISNKRLIKIIRGNLALKWIQSQFPKIKIIFIIRHPLAIALSKLNLNWKPSINKYLRQEALISNYLSEPRKHLNEISNPFEEHLFQWGIENIVPLTQFEPNDIFIIPYEILVSKPKQSTKEIFKYLNISWDKQILKAIRKPSILSRKTSAVLTGEDIISKWKKEVTKSQLKNGIKIISFFGLDKLYSEEALPLIHKSSNIQKLFTKK